MIKKISALVICVLFSGIGYAFSQNGTNNAAPQQPGSGPGAAGTHTAPVGSTNTPPAVLAKVDSLSVFHPGTDETGNASYLAKPRKQLAHAGNTITFYVSGALAFLKAKPSDQAKVVLYVNNIEMPGITSEWNSQLTTMQIQSGKYTLPHDEEPISITLVRNPASQNSWNFLYSNAPSFTDSFFDVKNASLGWEHMSALDKGNGDSSLTIIFFDWWEMMAWGLLYLVIIVLFLVLACKTDVLKANADGPYSLSNTQLLFWTSLVMGAFIYTLLLTDISMSFNTSILYMMGISLGTTGAAVAIDQNKIVAKNIVPKKPEKFFKDLLTDGNSYSIQRVQAFFWNLILGLYFIVFVIKNKTMPEFSSTMLLLAGFSSTAYLAGKLPENTPAAVDSQAAAQQAAVAQQQPAVQQPVAQQQPGEQQQGVDVLH